MLVHGNFVVIMIVSFDKPVGSVVGSGSVQVRLQSARDALGLELINNVGCRSLDN